MRLKPILIGTLITVIVLATSIFFWRGKPSLPQIYSIKILDEQFMVAYVKQKNVFEFQSSQKKLIDGLSSWQTSLLVNSSNYSRHLNESAILDSYEIGKSHAKQAIDQAAYISKRFGSADPPINYKIEQIALVKDSFKNIFLVFLRKTGGSSSWTSLIWTQSSWKLESPAITNRRSLGVKMEMIIDKANALVVAGKLNPITVEQVDHIAIELSRLKFDDAKSE